MSALVVPISAYAPEALALAGTLLIFLMDAAGVRHRAVIGGLATFLLLVALLSVLGDLGVPFLSALSSLPSDLVNTGPIGPIQFTTFGLLWQAIFLSAALLVAFASLSEGEGEREVPIFYALLSLATLGMLLVALAADLIFLLLAIELTGISTYVLVAYARQDPRGLEAAMKFYLIGALSSAISFFGASLIYGAYGTTSLAILQDAPANGDSAMVLVGLGLIAVGLGFKATLVPFHMWAVDVYDGAPDTVSAFLAAGSKKMGILAFIVVFVASVNLFQGNFGYPVYIVLGALAVATMTTGNVLALQQRTMKRMLAYSSISQAGYLLIGIAVDTPAGLSGATVQAIAHVMMKGGAFVFVAAMTAIGVGNRIDDYRGLGRTHPVAALCFSIFLLSLAGIPLTLGFIGKFYLFGAAVQRSGFFIFLAIAGLLNSAVSVFYYARVLRIMYMVDPISTVSGRWTPAVAHLADPGAGSSPPARTSAAVSYAGRIMAEARALGVARWTALVICAALTIILGIYPTPLLNLTNFAATHFLPAPHP
jgi:proton-translocating NADH-quinone oxidoreductase chain N